MTEQTFNIEETVFPIWQAASLAQDMARDIQSGVGSAVKTHIPIVDKIVHPFHPGTLVSIIGRPGHGKSFLSSFFLYETMKQLELTKADKNNICVLISAEVPVETAALQWMARISGVPVAKVLRGELTEEELNQVDDSAYQVIGLPLFIIGHSTQRGKDNRRKRPNLSPDNIDKSMEYLLNTYRDPETDRFLEPRLIVTDYLQRLHKNDPRMDDTKAFSGMVDWAKDIAIWGGCTHMLDVQAGRQVDSREIKIPMIGDGQSTSNIEQSTDVLFATMIPSKYNIEVMPALTSWGVPETIVTKNMLYLALLKQKDDDSNFCWRLNMDYQRLGLSEVVSH